MKAVIVSGALALAMAAAPPTHSHTLDVTALDIPVIGDFDGDHIPDVGIVRRSLSVGAVWSIRLSSTGDTWTRQWGLSTDTPIVADFDGDGRIDPAIYRPDTGQFWILKSTCQYRCYDVLQPSIP